MWAFSGSLNTAGSIYSITAKVVSTRFRRVCGYYVNGFDTLSHTILLAKLEAYGLGHSSLAIVCLPNIKKTQNLLRYLL